MVCSFCADGNGGTSPASQWRHSASDHSCHCNQKKNQERLTSKPKLAAEFASGCPLPPYQRKLAVKAVHKIENPMTGSPQEYNFRYSNHNDGQCGELVTSVFLGPCRTSQMFAVPEVCRKINSSELACKPPSLASHCLQRALEIGRAHV